MRIGLVDKQTQQARCAELQFDQLIAHAFYGGLSQALPGLRHVSKDQKKMGHAHFLIQQPNIIAGLS
jgi:hypothetical protein